MCGHCMHLDTSPWKTLILSLSIKVFEFEFPPNGTEHFPMGYSARFLRMREPKTREQSEFPQAISHLLSRRLLYWAGERASHLCGQNLQCECYRTSAVTKGHWPRRRLFARKERHWPRRWWIHQNPKYSRRNEPSLEQQVRGRGVWGGGTGGRWRGGRGCLRSSSSHSHRIGHRRLPWPSWRLGDEECMAYLRQWSSKSVVLQHSVPYDRSLPQFQSCRTPAKMWGSCVFFGCFLQRQNQVNTDPNTRKVQKK